MISKSELACLIYLLDDNDREVYTNVRNKLTSLGTGILQELDIAVTRANSQLVTDRLEGVIHKIHYAEFKQKFKLWCATPQRNLLDGAMLIASYQHPDLNEFWISNKVADIVKNIYFELSLVQPPLKSVSIFNKIFFDSYEFRASNRNDYNPRHFFINHVLSFKTGEPIMLAMLYLIIAAELELPIFGVSLPDQIVLAYADKKRQQVATQTIPTKKVQFYINPENKGAILTKKDMNKFLDEDNWSANKDFFYPCCNTTMMQMLIDQLSTTYHHNKDIDKAQEISDLSDML